ncbi:MAG TPA: rhomboid family intramembrane serine protease [Acidimicrobiales bacterium]|nr:rhomboid family intramembrane serine protease [Acidimicrobiales bacterium]
MIPLKDENPTRTRPLVTMVLIGICAVIFFAVQPHDQGVEEARFSFANAAIPCEVVHNRALTETEVVATVGPENDSTACDSSPEGDAAFPGKHPLLAVLYSMFLHGGLLHLGGNMLFLWIFGNNIEDVFGKVGYLAFYLIGGLVATLAHIAVQPSSTVPLVGASGAIAAVMGAYLVLFPNAQIRTLFIFIFILFRDVRAKWLLGFWFVSQFFTNPAEGVAWMAHVGGFVFGVLVGLVLRNRVQRDPVYVPSAW